MKESFNGDYYKDLLIYLKDFIIYLDLWVLNYNFNSQNYGQNDFKPFIHLIFSKSL